MLRRTRFSVITTLLFAIPASASATTVGPVTELAPVPNRFSQRAPSIDWDGTSYVMVWEDSRAVAANGVDIFLARIQPDGTLSDAMGIPVLTDMTARPGNQTQPSIGWSAVGLEHLIVWTDPRNTSSDIFGARFLPSSGTIVEQGGFSITTETSPDVQASVAFATGSFLVVWETNVGGVQRVKARRIYPDAAPVDAMPFFISGQVGVNELNPRVIGSGTTFIASWEDDRNVATSGLDIFARALPDMGTISASNGVAISTAAFRQTTADLTPLGTSFAFVWQDQRLGPGVDENIWRARTSATIQAIGQEAIVTNATRDQTSPRIAGDSSRALAIWQDRRSGTFGETFGARLDAAGNVLDPRGVPLLLFNQNAIEHAIAKGPAADYLVAAVRFDPQGTPRIFYRIVRDEPPAGTMTAGGTLTVPSDGTTPAAVTFGPAQGASGLPVADTTLYTVSLSNMSATLTSVDADPMTAGVQVEANNGIVGAGLTSLQHGTVDVTVRSIEGTSMGTGTVTFTDVPPVAQSARITPLMPTSSQDLSLSYAYADVNMDPESGTVIEWLKDLAIQGTYQNMRLVPASALRRGDHWRARVIPNDGIAPGQAIFSNTATIGNSAPSAENVLVVPDHDGRTGTTLAVHYIFVDRDNDTENGTQIDWYQGGMLQAALHNARMVPGAMVVKGQTWAFTVQPFDGMEHGPIARSATSTIVNTAPVANAGMNSSVIERRHFVLDGTMSADVDPQDSLRFTWTQVTGPTVALSSTSTKTPSFTAPSVVSDTVLQFDLVVNDGEVDSPPSRVTINITAVADSDMDGLDDEEEAVLGTDPHKADTDEDGLSDGDEVAHHTDPKDEDSDDDGVRDGAEGAKCAQCMPDPFADHDGDQLIDALDPDSDNDGLFDGLEVAVTQAPMGTDMSKNHFAPDQDIRTTTDPTNPDTDGDRLLDGVEDANHNGRVDPGESDPNNPADPPMMCTTGTTQCPPGTECRGGVCMIAMASDASFTCRPLADEHVECCMGGCTGGTNVMPLCTVQGALEQCPIGAMQCAAGSCSKAAAPKSGGCGCSAAEQSKAGAPWLFFVLVALVGVARRRVRSSSACGRDRSSR